MLRKLNTFIKLPFRLKLLFLESVILITIIRILLGALPFGRIRQYFRRVAVKRHSSHHYSQREITQSVKLASKYLLIEKPCLVQSMVLWLLFRRRGYDAELHIGVLKDTNAEIQAHAWVESNGLIAIGWLPNMTQFTSLPNLDFDRV